uniref:Uncharacterized protein n=1 Tax=Glossina brevipalpis TaxID=37001 RepID=A0A1A9WIW3_9MUSC
MKTEKYAPVSFSLFINLFSFFFTSRLFERLERSLNKICPSDRNFECRVDELSVESGYFTAEILNHRVPGSILQKDAYKTLTHEACKNFETYNPIKIYDLERSTPCDIFRIP